MRSMRILNSTISFLFFSLGIILLFSTDKIYKISCEIYINCSHAPLFHIHGRIWFALFLIISLALYVIGGCMHGRKLQALNILSAIILFILVVHVVDLYIGSLFCHDWGCTYTLPTWKIFTSAVGRNDIAPDV